MARSFFGRQGSARPRTQGARKETSVFFNFVIGSVCLTTIFFSYDSLPTPGEQCRTHVHGSALQMWTVLCLHRYLSAGNVCLQWYVRRWMAVVDMCSEVAVLYYELSSHKPHTLTRSPSYYYRRPQERRRTRSLPHYGLYQTTCGWWHAVAHPPSHGTRRSRSVCDHYGRSDLLHWRHVLRSYLYGNRYERKLYGQDCQGTTGGIVARYVT